MDLVAAVQPILNRLNRLPPEQRARQAHEMWAQVLVIQAALATSRRSGVREMRAAGLTLADIAELLGVSVTRIKQVEQGLDRAERKAAKEATASNGNGN